MVSYIDAKIDAVGDATRRAILDQLLAGPMAVGDIASAFSISRPAISQHLRILKEAGLVEGRAEGNRRLYRLEPAGFAALRDYFDQFWADSQASFAKATETPDDETWRAW